jgi:hypothetical protein
MTVLEPMPERTGRGAWLRRGAYAASASALTFAFAFSLSGIASTQGTVRPDGHAAALVAKQARSGSVSTHRSCHRGAKSRAASRRV